MTFQSNFFKKIKSFVENAMIDSANTTKDDGDEIELFSLYVTIPLGVLLAVLVVLAVSGNALTIIAFARDKSLRTVYNMYLVNLAVTDFCLGLFSMLFYSVYTLASYIWPFGYHFCKAFLVVDFTLCLESIITIVMISFDRLLLLKHGPHYIMKETTKKTLIKIFVSWILSFSLYSPAIIGWDLWMGEDINDLGDCDVQFAYHFIFTTATAIIEFVIPLFAVTIINFLIYLQIRKRTVVSPLPNGRNFSSNPITEQTTSAEEREKTRKDIKAARFLAMLVLVFAITWAPYTIATIIISFCDSCIDTYFYEFLVWLLWAKSAINPFLYALNSALFYKNFRKLLRCRKKPNNANHIPTVVSHVAS